MGVIELVDHIEATHHRYLWDELPRLIGAGRQGRPACTAAAIRSWRTSRPCFGDLRADLEPHMLKEERVLFPMIRELAIGDGAAGVPLRDAAATRSR